MSTRTMNPLRQYVLVKVAGAIVLIFCVMTLTFLIIHLAPGDPINYLYGPTGLVTNIEEIKQKLGLNDPLPIQYARYLGNLFHGDLGYSAISRKSVSELIVQKIYPTLLLNGTSFLISVLLGIVLGVYSAKKPRSKLDYSVIIFSLFGYSLPSFWFSLMLIVIFSVKLGWFPAGGMTTLGANLSGFSYLVDLIHHMFLPTLALSLWYTAIYSRLTRSSMLEVVGKDYILTAWSKGLDENTVYFRHALRNALLPVVTMIGYYAGLIFTGAVMVETVFALPGLGKLIFDSILHRDYPVILGCFLLVSITVIVVNIVTDIVYAILDPRVRFR